MVPVLDVCICKPPQYPIPVIPSHVLVITVPEPQVLVSHTPESQRPEAEGTKINGAVVLDVSKSTFIPTAMAGVPLVKIEGLARVKYFLTPRASK